MNQEGLERLLALIASLKRRNKDLSTRLAQVEASRDRWKARAIERGKELDRRRLRKRKVPPRTYTAEQWRQHDLIVARIRAIPDRESRPSPTNFQDRKS